MVRGLFSPASRIPRLPGHTTSSALHSPLSIFSAHRVMAVPLLAAVNASSSSPGLTPGQLSYIGHVYVDADSSQVDQILSYITKNASLYDISVNTASINDVDNVIALLNAGAARVFATCDQLSVLKGTVDDSRLVLLIDPSHHNREKSIDVIADTSVGILAHKVSDIDFITGWLNEYGTSNRPPVFVSFANEPPSLEDICHIRKLAATPIVSSAHLTLDPETNPNLLPVGEILMTGLVSDRADKLISTIVVDEQGVALGLVYSSQESVKESLKTGTGVYQSRKRGLWYKGATSGAVQELVRIDADCDQDCLRFVVRQKGAGRKTSH